MLNEITPLILTFNEEENIVRTLSRLAWARDIVVLDSGSTDRTAEIANSYPNVRLFVRPFDNHANQWNYGLQETAIRTCWVLALDADYQVCESVVDELRSLQPAADVCAYRARFVYCVGGMPLRGSLYPPVTVLFRKNRACAPAPEPSPFETPHRIR